MASPHGKEGRVRRCCLTVPAASERFVAKARETEVDEVVLDMEDSVPPAEKTEATRLRVANAIAAGGWRPRTIVVRVNATSSPHCLLDLLTIVPLCDGNLHCVVIPKVEGPFDVVFVERMLALLERQHDLTQEIGIEVLIETAAGLVRCSEIAAASPRVEALIFGPGDFAASMGAPTLDIGHQTSPGAHLSLQGTTDFALFQILSAARAAGVQAIDGPFGGIDDREGLLASAQRTADLGFDGKWAIHPSQIDPLRETFTPSARDVQRARDLLSEYVRATGQGQGAARLGGEMIDEASVRLAENLLRRAGIGWN